MPDYDLSALSTRSFEHLVQAIALKVLGFGTVIFGDGPDGAREATFEGQTSYPSSAEPWRGYVVVQAKFRQKCQGVRADGKWFVGELAKELKKYSTRKRNLRCPEYYIFCTNVVLTPSADTGSKDRANRILQQFSSKNALKGFAIWDSDQLRAFLDTLPDVRQAYAAWITAGDVLSEVIRSRSLVTPRLRHDHERLHSKGVSGGSVR